MTSLRPVFSALERIYLDEAGNTLPYGNLAREACLLEAVGVGECILYMVPLFQNPYSQPFDTV